MPRKNQSIPTHTSDKPFDEGVVIEIPKWVTSTPPDIDYYLEMAHSAAKEAVIETLPLTRKEYLQLKRHLIELRGYPPPEENDDAAN
jgi:hypothetical protein